MSSSNILQEYLVSIGFKFDNQEVNRANKVLGGINLGFAGIAKMAASAATAATAMVSVFATQMEKLYYASQRSQSAAANIQGLAAGAERIGVGGDRIQGALIGMAAAMRSNPGLKGLLESLGVKVTGRDMSDVMLDTVDALKQMPFYVGSQYANMFGMDPDTFLLVSQNVDKLREYAEANKKLYADAGVNLEEATKASIELKNAWRDITDSVSVLVAALSIKLMPALKEAAETTKGILRAVTDAVNDPSILKGVASEVGKDWKYRLSRPLESLGLWWDAATGNEARPGVQLSADSQRRLAAMQPPPAAPTASATTNSDASKLFTALEAKYALPPGLLDAMWWKESGRGQHMTSSAGAQGHFQFMPDTAKDFGITDPNDLGQSATGAARFMQRLLSRYGGNLDMALAAYNWGAGNLDKYGLGNAPAETRDYVPSIERKMGYTQTTYITVQGSADPAATAHAVAGEQKRVASDVVRNLKANAR